MKSTLMVESSESMKCFLLTILVCVLFTGCERCEVDATADVVAVCGNEITGIRLSKGEKRISGILGEGATLSFFARRGICAENKLLTWSEGAWRGGRELQWEEDAQEAMVTAYCPPLPDDGVYYRPDGQPVDWLVCREDYGYREPVVLHFVHAMAKVVFQVGSDLNGQMKRLTLLPSVRMTGFEVYSGRVKVEDGGKGCEVWYSQRPDGCYELLVPPAHRVAVELCMEMEDGVCYRTELKDLECIGGDCYVVHVGKKEEQIGIYTAEDFIAFTHLINGEVYQGRSLEEFGEKVNGRMTYRLKADIEFSEEERKRICQIGHSRMDGVLTTGFQEVFDGENHVLGKLFLPATGCEATGLFLEVGEQGVVRNLVLRDAYIDNVRSCITAVSFLCSRNLGLIANCRLVDSCIESAGRQNSGLVTLNYGQIVNCRVENLVFNFKKNELNSLACGGILNQNQSSGAVLNSYARGIEVKWKKKEVSSVSALCHYNKGVISNCYGGECGKGVHPLSQSNHRLVSYCYYPAAWKGKDVLGPDIPNSETGSYHVAPYRSVPMHPKELSLDDLAAELNGWIESVGRNDYPQYQFLPWKVEAETTVTFDSLEDCTFFTRIESEQR